MSGDVVITTVLYRQSDGLLIAWGGFDGQTSDTIGVGLIADGQAIDARTMRWDVTANAIRSATPGEVDAAVAEERDRRMDSDKALEALARITYLYLPSGKPATFGAFAQEVKQRYRTL